MKRFEKLETKFDTKFDAQNQINMKMFAILQRIDNTLHGSKEKMKAR